MRLMTMTLIFLTSIVSHAQQTELDEYSTECGKKFYVLSKTDLKNIEISYDDYKKFGGGPITYPIYLLAGGMMKGIVAISNANEKQYYRVMSEIYSSDLNKKMHGIGLLHTRFAKLEDDQEFPWIPFVEMMMSLVANDQFCVEKQGIGFTAEARKKLEEMGYKNEFELHMIGIANRDPKAIKFANDQYNYEWIIRTGIRTQEETEKYIREQMPLFLKSKKLQ